MSNPTNQKLHEVATISTDHIAKMAWEDTRNDGGGIYAQNINPDGELGNIVVPVELLSFIGVQDGNTVTLKWQTATELNNRGFQIERLSNGTWSGIGFVQGSGTSTSPHYYSFADKNLDAGTYSYRLKQIDNDGSSKYINLTESFTIQPGEYSLSQNYPNPFNPTTSIQYQIPTGSKVKIVVYDVLGKQVSVLVNEYQNAGTYTTNFDASKLASGIYLYRMEAGNFVKVNKMLLLK
jgi:hypothetical protein